MPALPIAEQVAAQSAGDLAHPHVQREIEVAPGR